MKIKQLCTLALIILSTLTCATVQAHEGLKLQIQSGINYINRTNTQTSFTEGDVERLRATQDASGFIGAIGLGYHFTLNQPLVQSMQVSFNYYLSAPTSEFGQLTWATEPDIAAYNYKLNLLTNRFMLDLKLNAAPVFASLSPYLTGGIGLSRYSVQYQELAIDPGYQPETIDYPGETHYQFAYEFGAGLDWSVSKALTLSLGYLYSNSAGQIDIPKDSSAGMAFDTPSFSLSSHSLLMSVTLSL